MRSLAVFCLLALSCNAIAAPGGKPDFSGIWELEKWATEPWPAVPPFTEAGLQAQQQWQANQDMDPTHQCLIQLVRIVSAPFPHEVIQQPERLTFLYEYEHQVRRVFMDGRGHPADGWPTLMGHSIGHWDGDTLVIDTVNVEAGYLRPQGFPHTEDLHVIERHTLFDNGNKKRVAMTIDDPKYYREPWTVETVFLKSDTEILDYECIVREHIAP